MSTIGSSTVRRLLVRGGRIALALLPILTAAPPASHARERPGSVYSLAFDRLAIPEEARFRLVLNDLTVSEALRFILQNTGLHVIELDSLGMPARGVLDSVTVAEALEVLARKHDLAYHVEGDHLVIGRTESRTFPINQVVVAESQRWMELEQNLQKLLSEQGRFVLNAHSGILTVTDRPSAVRRVEGFLEALEDDYSQQVELETRIVEIQLNEETEIGIDWTAFAHGWEGFAGNTASGGIFEQRTVTGNGLFQFGLIRTDRLDLLIDMLRAQGRMEIISRPRVVTMGNEAALFSATESIPYFIVDIIPTEGTSPYIQYDIEFREAGVSLEALAHVGPDGRITLQVHPVVSEVTGFTPSLPNLPPQPIIDQRETRTTVRLRDSETLVIGGLLVTREERDRRGIPLLSQIPVVGGLFGNTVTSKKKMELVVILTPRVLQDSVSGTLREGDRSFLLDPPALHPWTGQARLALFAHEHNRAVSAFLGGNPAAAARHARRALATAPEMAWERLNLAVYLINAGRPDESLRQLLEIEQTPGLGTPARANRLAWEVLREPFPADSLTMKRWIDNWRDLLAKMPAGSPGAMRTAIVLNLAGLLAEANRAGEAAMLLETLREDLPAEDGEARHLIEERLAAIDLSPGEERPGP